MRIKKGWYAIISAFYHFIIFLFYVKEFLISYSLYLMILFLISYFFIFSSQANIKPITPE